MFEKMTLKGKTFGLIRHRGLKFFLFALFLSITGAVSARDKTARKFTEGIPFQFVNGEILIDVTIQGKAYSFIFDTGAPTIISDDLRDELGIEENGQVDLSDGTNHYRRQKLYTINNILVGNTNFSNTVCISVPLGDVSEQLCHHIDGIIGANLMKQYYWTINFEKNILTLSTVLPDVPASAKALHFYEGMNGSPYLQLQCGDSTTGIEFDTGSNGPVVLSDSIWFNSPEGKKAPFATLYGILGQTVYRKEQSIEYLCLAHTLRLDRMEFENILVGSRNMNGRLQTLGTKFMKNYHITLDWRDHIIFLDQVSAGPVEPFIRSIGISINLINGKLLVSNLWKNSLAEKQGIKLGDEIISVNGESVLGLSEEKYCDLKELIKNSDSLTVTTKGFDGNLKDHLLKNYDVLK